MFNTLNETLFGKIPTGQYYVYRMLILPLVYFFLSLLYLVLSICWQIPLYVPPFPLLTFTKHLQRSLLWCIRLPNILGPILLRYACLWPCGREYQ